MRSTGAGLQAVDAIESDTVQRVAPRLQRIPQVKRGDRFTLYCDRPGDREPPCLAAWIFQMTGLARERASIRLKAA